MVIICISGTPATGKTSVARALAKKLGWKLIELNKLAQEKNLYCGYDRKRKTKIVDIGLLKNEIKKIKQKNLILESHYSHEFDCDFVIVLRTNPGELRKRMKSKKWEREKIEENIEAEIMEICKTEALDLGRKVIEIDTTGRNPGELAKEIIRKINHPR